MLLKNGLILSNGGLIVKDILIGGGVIKKIGDNLKADDAVIDVSKCWVIPGAIDVHAHFREPGFENKGTVFSESQSAAKGGIVTAMAMPNLCPAPDRKAALDIERDIIAQKSLINVYPYGCVTKGEKGVEPADYESMKGYIKAITDDGRGVNNLTLLRQAMLWAKANGVVVASHAEAEGYGDSPEAEYIAVERELQLAKEIGCKYHFCHISTQKAFEMIKTARLNGVNVTCEVTPHHLTLCGEDVCGNTNFKMNPPLRTRIDMECTVNALLDGTADMIATDHAPHAENEKAVPYPLAPNGVIGFETMLPVCYTALVKTGLCTHGAFLKLTVYNPAERFGLPVSRIAEGERADLAVLDIHNKRAYTKEEIKSKGVNSPFIGRELYGFNRLTILNGNIIYTDI